MNTPFEIMYGGRTREEMAELIKSAADVIKGNSNRQSAIMETKSMNMYSLFCTTEQTRRAYKLGAPLSIAPNDFFTSKNSVQIGSELYSIPTTQQMLNWLYAEKGIDARRIIVSKARAKGGYGKIEHADIDAALDYLEKGGTK